MFLAGLFSRLMKPYGAEENLSETVDELRILVGDEITNRSTNLPMRVLLHSVTADAPAKTYMKQVKQHNGYFNWYYFTAKWTFQPRPLGFPNSNCRLKRDQDFRSRRQDEHNVGKYPFEALIVDMIQLFLVDYMHVVCLDLTKQLLSICCREDTPIHFLGLPEKHTWKRYLICNCSELKWMHVAWAQQKVIQVGVGNVKNWW